MTVSIPTTCTINPALRNAIHPHWKHWGDHAETKWGHFREKVEHVLSAEAGRAKKRPRLLNGNYKVLRLSSNQGIQDTPQRLLKKKHPRCQRAHQEMPLRFCAYRLGELHGWSSELGLTTYLVSYIKAIGGLISIVMCMARDCRQPLRLLASSQLSTRVFLVEWWYWLPL